MKTLKTLAGATLLAGFAMSASAHDLPAKSRLSSGVIHVSATGSADIAPDRAKLSAGVQSQAETAKAAMALNSDKMRRVYDALTEAGVNRRDISTSYLNLSPQYNYRDNTGGQPRLTGYQASNQVTIDTADLDGVGNMIDALLDAGLNNINNVQFVVKDQDAALDKARKDAIRKARQKAEMMTQAAGVTLGRLLVITEGTSPGAFFQDEIVATGMRVQAVSAAPPLSPGQRELSATVTLSYAID